MRRPITRPSRFIRDIYIFWVITSQWIRIDLFSFNTKCDNIDRDDIYKYSFWSVVMMETGYSQ